MGVKQSVQIETPKFNPDQWQPIDSPAIPEQYGIFRTLCNRQTGELIDEYDFLWPSEDEYLYYLKSFNWRHKQQNVVNARYIELSNHQEICSHSYMAKIYIEHIRSRVSEISDIPYPDNLYVLMESLEGYSRIYEKSKYFQVQENQICVDQAGNVKVWINADLSINYPDGEFNRDRGPEVMVDAIVSIIAANTDPQTEPSPTFKQFFMQKRGRGKLFEQAKVLVMNYARLNQTEIPSRFDALLNMNNNDNADAHYDLKSYTDHSKSQHNLPLQQVHYEQDQRRNADFYNYQTQQQQAYPAYQSPPIQNYSFGPRISPQFIHGSHTGAHQVVQQQVYPSLSQPTPPVYYIPHYARIQYPARAFNPNVPQQIYQIEQGQAFHSSQALPVDPVSSLHRGVSDKNSHRIIQQSVVNVQIGAIKLTNTNLIPQLEKHNQEDYMQEDDHDQEAHFIEPITTHKSTSHERNSIIQADDLVARSLPIKTGYPSQGTQQLSTLGHSDRAIIYSHINQRQVANADGFGLTKTSQLKLKDSNLSSQKGALSSSKQKSKANPMKYYYSLDEQLEIDPDIAADMAKYLS